ncbi:MAG: hypothetical protein J7452_04770 [Thermoflexus sp.]|nr:hypothetical protein [Thermoflexus sp.]
MFELRDPLGWTAPAREVTARDALFFGLFDTPGRSPLLRVAVPAAHI